MSEQCFTASRPTRLWTCRRGVDSKQATPVLRENGNGVKSWGKTRRRSVFQVTIDPPRDLRQNHLRCTEMQRTRSRSWAGATGGSTRCGTKQLPAGHFEKSRRPRSRDRQSAADAPGR